MICDTCGYDLNTSSRCLKCGASLVPKPKAAGIPAPEPPAVDRRLFGPGFWSFDQLITRSYIQMIFKVGCVLIGLAMLIILVAATVQGGVLGFLAGAVAAAVFGGMALLAFRLFCEGAIVFFRIHEELQRIGKGAGS